MLPFDDTHEAFNIIWTGYGNALRLEAGLKFPTVKIRDFESDRHALERSANPVK